MWPAIRRTRRRCENAPPTTSAIVAIDTNTIGNSKRPSSGIDEYNEATTNTTRPQAMAMRRTKPMLLNMVGAGR